MKCHIKSKIPVLLDIFTPFCGPCRMIAPILDELTKEYNKKVKIVKLDASEEPDLASSYKITKVPTLIAFKNGVEVERKSGSQTKFQLKQWLDSLGEKDNA